MGIGPLNFGERGQYLIRYPGRSEKRSERVVELDCDSLHLGNGKRDTPKRTGLGRGCSGRTITVGRTRGLEEKDNIKASRAQGSSD